MSKDTGGQAFPTIDGIEKDFRGRLVPEYIGGMTLRDYFAINCSELLTIRTELAEKLIGEKYPENPMDELLWSAKVDAKLRYISADAMLAERAK